MTEYDPMAELGLTHDKQVICNPLGFLHTNDSTENICSKYIRDGDRFFDLMTIYTHLVNYYLDRDKPRTGTIMKNLIPFLKAFGATDYGMYQTCRESLRLMPHADTVMNYFMKTLPVSILSSSYEHNSMILSEVLNLPVTMFSSTDIEMDSLDMSRNESRLLRDGASKITSLKIPKNAFSLGDAITVGPTESKLIDTLDDAVEKALDSFELFPESKAFSALEAGNKVYTMLNIRSASMIDLEGTAYIGGDSFDYQAMDIVKDGGGLSISFNGDVYATYGCNVAVMSRDCTVAAVLVQEFYNRGTEAVFDMISNWDRKHLEKMETSDTHIMKTMLANNPKKLPEVFLVDKSNYDEISKKSAAYRKKMFQSNY